MVSSWPIRCPYSRPTRCCPAAGPSTRRTRSSSRSTPGRGWRNSRSGSREGRLLPALARRHSTRRVRSGPSVRGGGDAPLDRGPVRRGAVRHGDTGHDRRLLPYLGLSRRGSAGRRVLARGDRSRPGRASRLRVRGRGVLGSRMGSAAAGFRLLLRQTSPRPAGRRRCGRSARPSRRRPRVPAGLDAVRREPRRAARSSGVRGRAGEGRDRHRVHPGRCSTGAPRAGRGSGDAAARLPGSASRRGTGLRPPRLPRCVVECPLRQHIPIRNPPAVRAVRVVRQRHRREPRRLVLGRRQSLADRREPLRRHRPQPRPGSVAGPAREGFPARRPHDRLVGIWRPDENGRRVTPDRCQGWRRPWVHCGASGEGRSYRSRRCNRSGLPYQNSTATGTTR